MAIGVFDSGVGGLGILAEIRQLLPTADLIYLADQAYSPYGVRTLGDLKGRCHRITEWLTNEGCDVITIACNTASAAALWDLRSTRPNLSIVGMEPAVKPAVETTGTGAVGVVATAATFQGELFSSVVDRFAHDTRVLTAACPEWVQLVEAGVTNGPEAVEAVRRCLDPLLAQGIDVLVLACTHFPELADAIASVTGPGVRLVDPAPAVARQTQRIAAGSGAVDGQSTTRLFTTGNPDSLDRAARRHGIEGSVRPLTLP